MATSKTGRRFGLLLHSLGRERHDGDDLLGAGLVLGERTVERGLARIEHITLVTRDFLCAHVDGLVARLDLDVRCDVSCCDQHPALASSPEVSSFGLEVALGHNWGCAAMLTIQWTPDSSVSMSNVLRPAVIQGCGERQRIPTLQPLWSGRHRRLPSFAGWLRA